MDNDSNKPKPLCSYLSSNDLDRASHLTSERTREADDLEKRSEESDLKSIEGYQGEEGERETRTKLSKLMLVAADLDIGRVDPEYRLWASVLKLAIREAMIETSPKLRRKALEWIFTDCDEFDEEYEGSIVWVCEKLNVNYLEGIRYFINNTKIEELSREQIRLFRW